MGKRFYKVLADSGLSTVMGFEWPLPGEFEAGEWIEAEGELQLCGNGIHVLEAPYIHDWLEWGHRLFVVETAGEELHQWSDIDIVRPRKRVFRRARLLFEYTDWAVALRRLARPYIREENKKIDARNKNRSTWDWSWERHFDPLDMGDCFEIVPTAEIKRLWPLH